MGSGIKRVTRTGRTTSDMQWGIGEVYREKGYIGGRRWVRRNDLAAGMGRSVLRLFAKRPRELDGLLSELCFELREALRWNGEDRTLINRHQLNALYTAILPRCPSWRALASRVPYYPVSRIIGAAVIAVFG